MKKSKIKKALLWIPTAAVSFLIMWPVYWIVKSSFTGQTDLFKSPIQYLPVNLTLANYKLLVDAAGLTEYLKGTIIITLASRCCLCFCARWQDTALPDARQRGSI